MQLSLLNVRSLKANQFFYLSNTPKSIPHIFIGMEGDNGWYKDNKGVNQIIPYMYGYVEDFS